jgi:hypothetical protein
LKEKISVTLKENRLEAPENEILKERKDEVRSWTLHDE